MASSSSELLGICEEVEVRTSKKRKNQDSEKGKKQQQGRSRNAAPGSEEKWSQETEWQEGKQRSTSFIVY